MASDLKRRSLLGWLLMPAMAAAAQGKGKGRQKARGAGGPRFGSGEVGVVLGYYQGGRGLPPGLAKRGGNLPPGLEKQLRRNGSLPPGLAKRVAPFPRELEMRLPPLPAGYRRVTLGTWALLVQDADNVIADIIDLSRR